MTSMWSSRDEKVEKVPPPSPEPKPPPQQLQVPEPQVVEKPPRRKRRVGGGRLSSRASYAIHNDDDKEYVDSDDELEFETSLDVERDIYYELKHAHRNQREHYRRMELLLVGAIVMVILLGYLVCQHLNRLDYSLRR